MSSARFVVRPGDLGRVVVTVGREDDRGALTAIMAVIRVCGLPHPTKIGQVRSDQGDVRWIAQTGGMDVICHRQKEREVCGTANCSCIHPPEHHCPVTGACLYTNFAVGPCPCSSTPKEVHAVLYDAWRVQRGLLGEGE